MQVIITCEYEKDRIKNGREKVATPFFVFFITLSVAMETISRIWPNFKLTQALVYFIVMCKYEEQPRKSGNTVFSIISLWRFFSDAQGQLTPQSVPVVGPVRISNSFKLLCMPSFPASMKRIQSKTFEKT